MTYKVKFSAGSQVVIREFEETYDFCLNYINTYNGTSESFFDSFSGIGGMVYIIESELNGEGNEVVKFETEIL